MLYHLVTFGDGSSVRAKSVKIDSPHSFEIITDKDEILLMYYQTIKNIKPTTSSWKTLKSKGVKRAVVD